MRLPQPDTGAERGSLPTSARLALCFEARRPKLIRMFALDDAAMVRVMLGACRVPGCRAARVDSDCARSSARRTPNVDARQTRSDRSERGCVGALACGSAPWRSLTA